jgi:hypothetical protein
MPEIEMDRGIPEFIVNRDGRGKGTAAELTGGRELKELLKRICR